MPLPPEYKAKGHPPYNKNGEGGRPSEYTDNLLEDLAKELIAWIEEDKENLFIQKFCFQRRINHRKISEFKERSKRFREACDLLDSKQQFALFEGGLKRKYAHPMCALILSHNHNINQKTEQKITGDALNPLHCILGGIDGETKELVSESE